MALVEHVGVAPGARRRLRLVHPATLRPLGELEVDGPDQARAAVDRVRKAQFEWADRAAADRGRVLERALRVLLAREEEFVDRIGSETGKPTAEILATEILPACDSLQFFAKRARHILRDRAVPLHLLKTKKLRLRHRPLGVVGLITPSNFPFLLALNPSLQALVAGNGVVLKPSEAAPDSGRLVAELWTEAGLPEGLFALLQGDSETGAALLDAGVDKICFTGSVGVGRRVAEVCGRNLVPCTLELGGKDPMIVLEDADLGRAARAAVYGAFGHAGQVCTSTERVYVVESVADEFVRGVLEETAALRQGADGEFDVGPMIRAEQLQVVEAHVQDALERGARLLAGGRRNPDHPGCFYEPTVLDDVNHEMRIMREETFGPVLPIMRVRDEDEAVVWANDSRYGLNASVWTRQKSRGARVARAVETGGAVVNDCMISYGVAEAPFGGVKQSGMGRVNGEQGLRDMCHTQAIVVDRFGGRREWIWFPHTERKARWLRRALRAIWGTSLGRWLA